MKPLCDPVFFCLNGILGGQGLQDCCHGYNHRSVHRCCKRDPWEDDQEICGQVEVLDAWISPREVCPALVPVGKQGFESQVCYHWLLWLICIVTIKFHKMSINIIIFINSIKFITFIIVIIFIILFIFVILIISIIFTIFLLFIFWYHHSSYNIMQNNCFFNVLSAWNYLIWKCNVSCVKSIFEIVLLSESIQCLTCHLHMDDCKSCVGSVIPSPPWHNCNWNCTVISVESTFWIVLLLEKHMDSHIDSVGSVTFLEIFSKIKNHLY